MPAEIDLVHKAIRPDIVISSSKKRAHPAAVDANG